MALDKFKNFLSGKDDSVNDSDEEYYNEEEVSFDKNMTLYAIWEKIEDYSINTTILLINIAFIAVFTLIISIVPILTLKKYDPIQLLMEEEK